MSTKRSLKGNRGRRRSAAASLAVSVATSLGVSFTLGCGVAGESEPIELSGPPPLVEISHEHSGDCLHGQSGPHGGRLIALGHDGQFHAELIVERADRGAGRVRLIALDRSLDRLPLEVRHVAICTYSQGAARTFELPALSGGGGEHATSSAELLALFGAGKAVACKVRLTIADKPYAGVFNYESRSSGEVAAGESDSPPAMDTHTSARSGRIKTL